MMVGSSFYFLIVSISWKTLNVAISSRQGFYWTAKYLMVNNLKLTSRISSNLAVNCMAWFARGDLMMMGKDTHHFFIKYSATA